mgnify:CR=1 FL=1
MTTVLRVADGDGKRLPAVPVSLEQNQKTIWSAMTDNLGEAELWVDPYAQDASTEGLTLVVNGIRQASAPKVTPWNVQQDEADVNFIQIGKAPTPEKKADLAFIVDATGSMGDEIDFLKEDLLDILQKLQQSQSGVDISTGAVFYRDEGDAYVTKYNDFTTPAKTISYVKKQAAEGGGDLPEAVHSALETALGKLSWNAEARASLAAERCPFMCFSMMSAPRGTP